MNIMALIITTLAGLSFLIGLFVDKFYKDKKNLNAISISLALAVMIGLICFDLIPEIFENIKLYSINNKLLILLSSIGIGFLILKILDIFVPHHHHEHHEHHDNIEDHNANLYHIGFVTSLALIIHNIIEGGSIYLNSVVDIKTGSLIALGVALHNLPLGVGICTTLGLTKKKFSKKIIPISLISLSTTLGAILIMLININNTLFITCLMGITVGMLLYLVMFELFKEVIKNIKNKYTIIGLIIGINLMIISFLI